MVRIPTHGQPTHPGEMLLEESLEQLGLTQHELSPDTSAPPAASGRTAVYDGTSTSPSK